MPIDNGFLTRRELVRKFNPNHDDQGRFASSGSGRRGGTAGAPTEDAFGNPLKRPSKGGLENFVRDWNKPPVTGGRKQTVAAHAPRAQQATSHVHGVSDGGRGPQGKFHVQNPAGPGFQFSSAQRQANAREMFGFGKKQPVKYRNWP